ncbi:MAG TPA: ABC transporter permease [Rectinemataceae bacterium]|nr:ABC transporter permease [Rectinemataceae bacterium]
MSSTAAESGSAIKNALTANAMQKVLAFASLVVLMLIFSLASPNFFQADNLIAIMLATAVNGVLALGVTFVIISAGIDLSVGTLMTFCAVMAGVFLTYWRLPIWVGVIGAMASGMVVGSFSGFLIAKLKIPPFIATLGMLNVTKGLSLIISHLKPIYFNDAPGFTNLALGTAVDIPGFAIPNAVIIFFALAILMSLVLNKTILGRYTYALGSNEEAVRLSGVNVDRWKIVVYMLCGLICGIAGILIGARLNSAQPGLGQGYELDAIAAAVIGGTSLSGGEGTILGTVIGAFIMSVLTNGLRILSVPQEWQTVVTGGIIIFAVYMDILRRRK